ncbi:intramolecular chaperone auto-processing domain protein [Vibrio phage 1.003.O._10N.286.48.A2]|nr:intramolecular chaperone auto-processing domain protein [Vibrio phage 1.003.O._10N.286.48.A2]
MSSNLIRQPYEMILDPTGGGGRAKPVANGKFYVGEIDKDPIANPRTDIAYKDESGQERPLTSPLTLNNSGAFVVSKNDGTIIQPYMKNGMGFSVLIKDARGSDVYSSSSIGDPGNISSVTSIVYRNTDSKSAVENMVDGNPTSANIGDICSTGGTAWVRTSITGSIDDFVALNKLCINDFGASRSKTEAENKSILDALILSLDGKRATITIGPDINYGYKRLVESTWPESVYPQMSDSIETNIYIADFSKGDPNTSNPGSRSGMQFREWFFTGKEQDGQHNGDFKYLNSKWHGGQIIYHNGGDEMKVENGGMGKNRRASFMTGVKGNVFWRFGQGGFTNDDWSDQQLANFLVSANGLPDIGVTGLTTCYSINKTDGKQGWNVSQPRYAFDFTSRPGQASGNVFGFDAAEGEPIILLQGDTAGKTLRVTSTEGGFSLADELSALYAVDTNGRNHRFRGRGGNTALWIGSDNKSRRLNLRDDNGDLSIVDGQGNSSLISKDDGSLIIGNGLSPTTDSNQDLGLPSRRFNDIYAVGTITPSDKNLKTSIRKITDDECRAALEVELVAYQYKNSVEIKGEHARPHYGVIAQDCLATFEKYGMTSNDISIVCIDQAVDPETHEYEGEVWAVRYTEFLVLHAEAMKRKVLGLI